MNPSHEKHFFDLAMKVITRQSSEQEQAELAELLARHPELQAEFEQLRADVNMLGEVSPLIDATQATTGELPAYASERLQQRVRQKIGLPQELTAKTDTAPPLAVRRWWWRWAISFAGATILIGLTGLILRNNGFFSSWLDLEGPSSQNINGESPFGIPRFEFGAVFINNAPVTQETENKEQKVIKSIFHSDVHSFSSIDDPNLKAWEADLPAGRGRTVVKLVYDRAGEKVQVIGRCNGKSFGNTFEVKDHDPSKAFIEAQKFIYLKITILQAQ